VVSFHPIYSLVREELDDYALLDFRVVPIINVFNIWAVEMHFCERSREDPGNLEMLCGLYGSKDMGIIAGGGIHHWKLTIMDIFQIPDINITTNVFHNQYITE
jgi:hypothetical protein